MDDAFDSLSDWSSSDDPDLDELLQDDDAEMMVLILGACVSRGTAGLATPS